MEFLFCGVCLAAAAACAGAAAQAWRKVRILRDQLIAFHAAGLIKDARCAALEGEIRRCKGERQQV